MKKCLFLLGLSSFSVVVFADEFATTDSGKRILVKDDGTWELIRTSDLAEHFAELLFDFSVKGKCAELDENLDQVRGRKEGKSSLFWFLG